MSFLHALDGEPLLQLAFIIIGFVGVFGNIAGFALKWAGEREHKRRQ